MPDVWVTIAHNFPLDSKRQTIHVFETEDEARKNAEGWAGKCTAYVAKVSMIRLLNILASSGEFHYLHWALGIETK